MPFKLPASICFRITRSCNAHCSFCLAPPDGSHPDQAALRFRLDWLIDRGVRSIQFCGGEPTTHPALPQLIAHVHARGVKTSLCSNALAITGALLPLLRGTQTRVRVSLHGNRSHHDAIVGAGCHDLTTHNLRRLLAAGVSTSLQTTVVSGGSMAVEWTASFCLEQGVGRLSVLPFIPRGAGKEQRAKFALSESERRALRDLVALKRRELSGRLDLRWLDFTAGSIPVVEPDGRLLLEGATEAMDRLLCIIPDAPSGAQEVGMKRED